MNDVQRMNTYLNEWAFGGGRRSKRKRTRQSRRQKYLDAKKEALRERVFGRQNP